MSAPGTFSAARILTKLGVRSSVQPEYRTRDMTPVIILADMSSSFAPEAVEARAINLDHYALVGKTLCNYELASRGRGGIIIEAMTVSADVAANAYFGISKTSVGLIINEPHVNVGGEPVVSVITKGFDQGLPSPAAIWPAPVSLPTERTYVPAGSFFQWGTYLAAPGNLETFSMIIWREIPESLGAP